MISRQCPKCDNKWHSANTKDWPCPECGMILTKKHEVQEEVVTNVKRRPGPDYPL